MGYCAGASMASHVAVRSQLCSAYCGSKSVERAMCPAIAKDWCRM
jgi:hypothetical protein